MDFLWFAMQQDVIYGRQKYGMNLLFKTRHLHRLSNVISAGRCYVHAASDAMFRRPAWLCLHPASQLSKMPHFGVAHSSGGYDPQIRTWSIFLCNAPAPSFIMLRLLVRKLSCWRTDKQTDAAENIQRSSLCYNVGWWQ